MEHFFTHAIVETLDVVKFNDILNNKPVLHDTKGRILAFGDGPQAVYSILEDHFQKMAEAAPLTTSTLEERDEYEDFITCAIIESLDVLKFYNIVIDADFCHRCSESHDAAEFGESPDVLYASMKKHFERRTRPGSGSARAAPSAETSVEASKKAKIQRAGAPAERTGAKPGPRARRSTGDASARLEKPRARYLLDPERMPSCKPSEALKTKLRTIIEDLIAGDGGRVSKREIGLMIDKSETPLGDDEAFVATAATEYDAWNSSLKHEEAFGAFLKQLWTSIAHGEAGAARGKISDSEEEEPIRRGKLEQPTPDSLEEGPRRARRVVASDSSEDDEEQKTKPKKMQP
jgi:hypothetical protein